MNIPRDGASESSHLARPEKSAIRELPPFEGLTRKEIVLLRNIDQVRAAADVLAGVEYVGFDTETKPVFLANQPKVGPHLLQIATTRCAFLCRPDFGPAVDLFRGVLTAASIAKAGFGLMSDHGPVERLLGARMRGTVELSQLVKQLGYAQMVGLQLGVAIVLGRYFRKSKRITTSNWGAASLSDAQLLYAANDAYASLMVYEGLRARLGGESDAG